MKNFPARTIAALSMALVLANQPLVASAEPSTTGAGGTPSPVTRAEKSVTRGAHAAAGGVEHGTKAAAHGVERGAKSAAGGVERGAKAAAHGVERGAKATVKGVERGVNAAAKGMERGAKATADTARSVSHTMGGSQASSAPGGK